MGLFSRFCKLFSRKPRTTEQSVTDEINADEIFNMGDESLDIKQHDSQVPLNENTVLKIIHDKNFEIEIVSSTAQVNSSKYNLEFLHDNNVNIFTQIDVQSGLEPESSFEFVFECDNEIVIYVTPLKFREFKNLLDGDEFQQEMTQQIRNITPDSFKDTFITLPNDKTLIQFRITDSYSKLNQHRVEYKHMIFCDDLKTFCKSEQELDEQIDEEIREFFALLHEENYYDSEFTYPKLSLEVP